MEQRIEPPVEPTMEPTMESTVLPESEIFALERPDPKLWTYYVITSFAAGPFFFIPLIFRTFRYRTLRYRFDDEGISVRWGVLFHREINLTYNRIQDIHLSSNVVARWLGLAEIQIQTASGSAKAEMTIEGMPQFAAIRDFLYSRMRGTRGGTRRTRTAGTEIDPGGAHEVVRALRDATEELRAIRAELERRNSERSSSGRPSAEPPSAQFPNAQTSSPGSPGPRRRGDEPR